MKKKYFARTMEDYDEELRAGYEDTMYLTGLLKEFEEIFREMKADRNMVDFDDVMHYAILILRDDMAADEYRKRFRYIFIDEFQDSNLLQEAIVGRITDGRNLFMVGDVKQSIYKFRLGGAGDIQEEISAVRTAVRGKQCEDRPQQQFQEQAACHGDCQQSLLVSYGGV